MKINSLWTGFELLTCGAAVQCRFTWATFIGTTSFFGSIRCVHTITGQCLSQMKNASFSVMKYFLRGVKCSRSTSGTSSATNSWWRPIEGNLAWWSQEPLGEIDLVWSPHGWMEEMQVVREQVLRARPGWRHWFWLWWRHRNGGGRTSAEQFPDSFERLPQDLERLPVSGIRTRFRFLDGHPAYGQSSLARTVDSVALLRIPVLVLNSGSQVQNLVGFVVFAELVDGRQLVGP